MELLSASDGGVLDQSTSTRKWQQSGNFGDVRSIGVRDAIVASLYRLRGGKRLRLPAIPI
jgi:hypothetical protein